MATVTFSFKDLVTLIGKDLSLDKVREDMFELGSETEAIEGDEVTFEVTSDRADLLCAGRHRSHAPGLLRPADRAHYP